MSRKAKNSLMYLNIAKNPQYVLQIIAMSYVDFTMLISLTAC